MAPRRSVKDHPALAKLRQLKRISVELEVKRKVRNAQSLGEDD